MKPAGQFRKLIPMNAWERGPLLSAEHTDHTEGRGKAQALTPKGPGEETDFTEANGGNEEGKSTVMKDSLFPPSLPSLPSVDSPAFVGLAPSLAHPSRLCRRKKTK